MYYAGLKSYHKMLEDQGIAGMKWLSSSDEIRKRRDRLSQ